MINRRVLLIGQAPGPNTDPTLPLYPTSRASTGGRLLELMGIDREEYVHHFDRVNLLNKFPGRNKRDDKFPMAHAKIAASAVKPLLHGRSVVMIGRNVAEAFQLEVDFHEWMELPLNEGGLCQVAVVPHPSGRNHWYNVEANRKVARKFWRGLIKSMREYEENVLSFVPEQL